MKCFFETIRVQDGQVYHLPFHNARLNATIKAHFNLDANIDLKNYITPPKKGLFRCKVIYSDTIESVNFYPYTPRKIKSFKLIASNIEYSYKYLDRSHIDALFAQKGECDDIIIVKNGLLTDTSIANIAFYYKNNWLTPKTPLLPGTTRARFIEKKILIPTDISSQDYKKFDTMALMNAMIDFMIIKDFTIKASNAL